MAGQSTFSALGVIEKYRNLHDATCRMPLDPAEPCTCLAPIVRRYAKANEAIARSRDDVTAQEIMQREGWEIIGLLLARLEATK